MAFDDLYTNLLFILRWLHVIAGITWIGHLYFFNFVNANFQTQLAKELKPAVNPQLLHRALWWFRWGAMVTFIVGWTLLFVKYSGGNLWYDTEGKFTQRAMWILFGSTLGSIMWFNVWFIIWPAQKQILGWVKAAQSPPEMPALVKRAAHMSKVNTYLSGPMLFGMIAPNNYPSINGFTLVACIAIGCGVVWLAYKYAPKITVPA